MIKGKVTFCAADVIGDFDTLRAKIWVKTRVASEREMGASCFYLQEKRALHLGLLLGNDEFGTDRGDGRQVALTSVLRHCHRSVHRVIGYQEEKESMYQYEGGTGTSWAKWLESSIGSQARFGRQE